MIAKEKDTITCKQTSNFASVLSPHTFLAFYAKGSGVVPMTRQEVWEDIKGLGELQRSTP